MQWVHILSAVLTVALIIQVDAFKSKKYHKYGKKYHKKGGYHGDYLSSYHGHHHHHHPISWLYIPDEHHHHHNSYHTYDQHSYDHHSYDHGSKKYHKHKDHKDKFSKFEDYKLEKYLHKKEKKIEKMIKKFVKKLPLILEILTKDIDKVPEHVHLRIPIPAIALEEAHPKPYGKVLEHPISYELEPEPKYSAKRSPAKRMVQPRRVRPTSSYTSYVVRNSDQYLHS